MPGRFSPPYQTSPRRGRSLKMDRIRITYSRTEPLRYTGNLDMQKVWERYLRRAGVQVAYTNGFHPQAKIQQACPLPLGFLGNNEIVDIWVDGPDNLIDTLGPALSSTRQPGIEIKQIEWVDLTSPAMATRVHSAQYKVVLFDPHDPVEIGQQIETLRQRSSILRERRGKQYDLRPLVEDIELQEQPEGLTIRMQLAARDSATGRPEEVLSEIGVDPHAARYIRTELVI